MAIIGGLAVSYALFSLTLGVRPDFISALGTWRYDMKLGVNLVLMIAATWVALRQSRTTETSLTAMRALMVPVLLLLAAVLYELVTVSVSAWPSRAMGENGVMCVGSIPLLALLPFHDTA